MTVIVPIFNHLEELACCLLRAIPLSKRLLCDKVLHPWPGFRVDNLTFVEKLEEDSREWTHFQEFYSASPMNKLNYKQIPLCWLRNFALRIEVTEYCKVGKYQLVEKLFQGRSVDLFLEAGAHDGWTGSDTYWLETEMGWRGILVEPVLRLYQTCRKERPNARVFHGALVSEDYALPDIEIECSGLVSSVKGSAMANESREITKAYYSCHDRPTVAVPAITLNRCIEEAGIQQIDFISLDVEGFEAQSIAGLNLNRWQPEYLLIECNDEASVLEALGNLYKVERRLPPLDILFKRNL